LLADALVTTKWRNRLEAATVDERADILDELARVAAAGDNDACGELAWAVLRFGFARSAIRKYLISDADTDAAEQATLVAVAFRIGSWRGEGRFTTWLHQVATNEAKQLIRSESRHSDRAIAADPDDVAEQFIGRVSSMIADAAMVRAAIEALPNQHRQALELREDGGLTYDEIADQLGIPLSTAKTWVRRGRIELAEQLTASIAGHLGT
jgi:RNA polymerase sigma-70 factor (ECF subfamily)